MTLLEQGRSLAADMAMGLASVWNHLWVLCVLNMPLTTSKTRGFTLELGIETKSREIILIRCFLIVVYNPPFLFQLFGKLVYHFSKNLAASIPFCVSYSYYDEVVHFNKMCSYHLPVSGQWISPVYFSHNRER